jgi:hypothetical protein
MRQHIDREKEPFQRQNSLKKGMDIHIVLMPG